MAGKKRKTITRKEVAKICNQIIFSKYVGQLAKNVKRMQVEGKRNQREMNQQMHNRQIESSICKLDAVLTPLVGKMNDLVHRVLLQDYIIGRITKAELITSLQEVHPDDPLSTVEHLEEIDRQRDAFEEHIKNVTR